MPSLQTPDSKEKNSAFVIRLTWDDDIQEWYVHLIPADGSKSRVFKDLESAFLHIAHIYTP